MARECPNKRALTLNEFVAYEQEENLYDVMMKLENAQGEEKVEDVIDVYVEDDDCDDVSKDMTRVMHMLHVDIENEHKGLSGHTFLSQELEVVQNSSKEISSKVVIDYVFDCINQPTFHYEHEL